MNDPIRLARRVSEIVGCSRVEAEQYIRNGWVSVDGEIIEQPQHRVGSEQVALLPGARSEPVEPATLLLHKPAGLACDGSDTGLDDLLVRATQWAEDDSRIRVLQRHFQRLALLTPLEREASGLVVLSQDRRVHRRLLEDAAQIEQEFVIEVSGRIAADGIERLQQGVALAGRRPVPCKVSWQNETHLRVAVKTPRPGQLATMCGSVGLAVLAIRRLRIGRIAIGKGAQGAMPAGQWRYLPVGERF